METVSIAMSKNVAFRNINGNYNHRPEKTMVSLSEDLHRNDTIVEGMPQLENNVLTGDVRRSAPDNGKWKRIRRTSVSRKHNG